MIFNSLGKLISYYIVYVNIYMSNTCNFKFRSILLKLPQKFFKFIEMLFR